MPSVEALLVHEDDPFVNPLGVKGVGEIGITGTVGAIANAVWHATGKRIRRFPIHVEDLFDLDRSDALDASGTRNRALRTRACKRTSGHVGYCSRVLGRALTGEFMPRSHRARATRVGVDMQKPGALTPVCR